MSSINYSIADGTGTVPSAGAAARRMPSEFRAPQRHVVYRTRGQLRGPITRLVSPSSRIAEQIKPFVFLDYLNVDSSSTPRFGWHPHSGIATLTLLLEGGFAYEDSTGAKGTMSEGAVEWMQSGGGVWHTGNGIGRRIKGYQLWVVLPPELENGPALSRYLSQDSFPAQGPARVILGELGGIHSPILAPPAMNYLDVRLKPGEVWRYDPPQNHDVAWMAVYEGNAVASQVIAEGEFAVFDETAASVTIKAEGKTSFILGSAMKHTQELVLGDYSVHTTPAALMQGESTIRRIAKELQSAGKL